MFLNHFETLIPFLVKFLLEVREPVSLKVATEGYFRGKKCQSFTYLML